MIDLDTLLTLFAIIAGVVAILELLEYIFTKNIPWLARLVTNLVRQVRRRLGRIKAKPGQRYLLLNFSSHPIKPGQEQALLAKTGWPSLEVVNIWLGNVPEDKDFVPTVLSYVDSIDLLPREWQAFPIAVVAAGYAPAWSVLLAELHGRLGYFPDLVRLRPAPAGVEEKFEVVEIVSLRHIRNQARAKR